VNEETVLLQGIVGSSAYGLATEHSDIDHLGIFAAPTRAILGLDPPHPSRVTNDPDTTMHEAAKYVRLALKCNPTVMELLWLPDDLYEVRTKHGDRLIRIREAFLSGGYVRNAYFGYAVQQFMLLRKRANGTFGPDLAKRTEKHARHMYRLMHQGLQLWTEGQLTIRLKDPEAARAFGKRVADGDIEHARDTLDNFRTLFDGQRCELPEAPDHQVAEEWLLQVRGV
jgi:predicted nucleotidyltransferase